MAMFRRSRKPAPPLHHRQQEIARREAELREKRESLERVVTQSRSPVKSKSARVPERTPAEAPIQKRFHVSIAMDTPQAFDTDATRRRPKALRKERRQGQIVFLILLVALAVAVVWLISHLNT
ncbi:MAG TPA: hypothetical protein VFQ78_02375 [Candidatus Udaeobacter sp.]|jgi:hypothetical protein|nr:hypothetical protein [Candidatus Udaeobacter sp.]